jgi:hypothetical protein
MKRVFIALLLAALMLAGGCTRRETYDYTYKGESTDWTAEYRSLTTGSWIKRNDSEHFDGTTEQKLSMTYKKDITALAGKHIVVSYETAHRGGSQTLDFTQPSPSGTFTLLDESSNNLSLDTEETVVTVTVEVDGDVQTLELKYAED